MVVIGMNFMKKLRILAHTSAISHKSLTGYRMYMKIRGKNSLINDPPATFNQQIQKGPYVQDNKLRYSDTTQRICYNNLCVGIYIYIHYYMYIYWRTFVLPQFFSERKIIATYIDKELFCNSQPSMCHEKLRINLIGWL